MLWVRMMTGRWIGRFTVLALLFSFSAAPALAVTDVAPDVSSHHVVADASTSEMPCEHAGHHKPASSQAGEHGCHCVVANMGALALPTVATIIAPQPTIEALPVPESTQRLSSELLSPPHRPPRV